MVVVEEESLTIKTMKQIDCISRLHWEEVSQMPFDYDPDWPRYQLLNELGLIKVFIARFDGNVIGYNTYYVTTHLQNKNYAIAVQDTLFVHPAHRNGSVGIKLITLAENKLNEMGVNLIIQTVATAVDISALFERLGYQDFERSMIKHLH